MTMTATAPRTASERQVNYLDSLTDQVGAQYVRNLLAERYSVTSVSALTVSQASELIGLLKTEAAAVKAAVRGAQAERRVVQEAVAVVAPLTPGAYQRDDQTIMVYPARSGEHLLAKSLHASTDEETGRITTWSTYLGSAARFVTAEMRMTEAQAAAWGHKVGVCCCCGRLLSNPESVELGIGPICRGKYF